jgi:hypothetical protein
MINYVKSIRIATSSQNSKFLKIRESGWKFLLVRPSASQLQYGEAGRKRDG